VTSAEAGAAALVTHPATTAAGIWTRGRLQPLPGGTLMGVPADPRGALGILDAGEVQRAAAERPWPGGALEGDVAVGDYVAARLGDAVVDRLVEPLLGGVYAGSARQLSLQACVPALFEAAREGGSLLQTAREASAGAPGGPLFAGLRGGVGRLPALLVAALADRGVSVRTGVVVRELRRAASGWELVAGSRPAREVIAADAVVLATPARPSARLLQPHAPAAAAALEEIPYASMAIVTLAVDRATLAGPLPGSGFLVPPVDGRAVKGVTFTSAKWAWAEEAAPDIAFLRASLGRVGEEAALQRPDEELIRLAVADLQEALGRPLGRLVDTHVQRWGGALPQYDVGHVERVERARAAVAALPGLGLAGAAYEGVGIPACIASGRAAAGAVATHVRSLPAWRGE
jgi:oxygen-dependent protoporphyrinogen oxidase